MYGQNFLELVIHEIDNFLWKSWMYDPQLNFPEKPFFPKLGSQKLLPLSYLEIYWNNIRRYKNHTVQLSRVNVDSSICNRVVWMFL